MIFEAAIVAVAIALLLTVLTVRGIDGEEHYGTIGFGQMQMSALNTFSVGRLDSLVEPDLLLSMKSGKSLLDISIDDVLCWDVREWLPFTNMSPDGVGSEDTDQVADAGITKDNTVAADNHPTADTIAQGTHPGGNQASVTGSSATSPQLSGQTTPRFEARWEYFRQIAEEQTAVGQILWPYSALPKNRVTYPHYEVNGVACHKLLTAAHYHLWMQTENVAATAFTSLGADVKRMSIDIEEVMFDREVILSILDAFRISSN